MKSWCSILASGLFFVSAMSLTADDWGQWRGPNRDGFSKETGLLKQWPKGGPQLLWTYKNAGLGFSSPSIVGDRLYTMGARNEKAGKEKTYLFCLDIGKTEPVELWSVEVGPIFTFDGNTWGDGPRGTPTVDGKNVYALSGEGDLVCVSTDGKLVWRKNMIKDFGGVMMSEWGYSESVLIDGDHLICMPGGKNGTLAALNKKTGAVIWRSKELTDKATYASLIKAKLAGVEQYIALTFVSPAKGGSAAGVSAKDGKLLWYVPKICGDSYALAPTPLVDGDQVYVTTGYGGGCYLFDIMKQGEKFEAKKLYGRRQNKIMKNTHGGVVKIGGYVYGHSERNGWVCQEWKSGREEWAERFKLPCTSGAMIAADGHLYLLSDEGKVGLVEANTKGFVEKGIFELPQKSNTPRTRATSISSKIWTHPVIANGCLYLRDQEYLFCYKVK